jgi:hypothetical protein
VVVTVLSDRTAPLFAASEDDLVPRLAEMEVAAAAIAMRHWAAEARERLGDDGSEPDPDRSAHLSPTFRGGRLDANLEPEAYQAAEAALRLALGAKTDDDPRSIAQRRHDALADIFGHFLDHQSGHRGGHRRPHVNITVELESLQAGTGQGTFDDGTPITATDARRMACDANVHRVITRADGSVLDYGRATRTVSAALFMVLCLRDRGCRFPGCDRPCHVTDAHPSLHPRPTSSHRLRKLRRRAPHWIDHGETNEHNLVLLCRWHHGVVHRPGWTIQLLTDATVIVTNPMGRRRTSHPPNLDALVAA